MLAGAVAQVATQFGDVIDGIIITELFWDFGSFSDNDLLLYRSDTGATDWPRSDDGALQETPEYQEWLTTKMANFIAHCRSLTAGILLVMDVRVNWNQPLAGRPDSGHDYAKLLRPALGLWSAPPASVGKTLVDLAAAHRVQVTPYSKMGTLLH